LPQGRGNESKNVSFKIRKASRARAPDSPMPGEGMGEVGCLFDEMGNLVEPTERRYMDVPAGPQRGMTTTRSVVERLQGDPEGVRHEVPNNPKRSGPNGPADEEACRESSLREKRDAENGRT
jgi:hypothetical protein